MEQPLAKLDRPPKISDLPVDQDSARGVPDPIGLHNGLLNADQHFGHRRFSSQILALQSLPRSSDLAGVGS
jgi:hypothetical protein